VELLKARGDREGLLAAARKTSRLIPPNHAWAKHVLAVHLIPLPEGRPLAESLLQDAVKTLPRRKTFYSGSHLLLGALMESREPEEARRHLHEARRSWRSGTDFDELLELTRGVLETDERPDA
jgi:hypothetical protein